MSDDRTTLVLDVPEVGAGGSAPRGEIALTGPDRAASVTGGAVVRDEHVEDGVRAIVIQAHDRRVTIELAAPGP